jgi:molecular chaperone GrpE
VIGGQDYEDLLQRFRDWLVEVEGECSHLARRPQPSDAPVTLRELVEHFTALRHEVKLQTKGSRGLQEQVESVVAALAEAVENLASVEQSLSEQAAEAPESVIETLMNLDDALHRGRGALEQARFAMEEAASAFSKQLAELASRLPWWRRWVARPSLAEAQSLAARHLARQQQVYDSLGEGYRLIQSRWARAMQEEQLETIDCLGRLVDPHEMTVVEAVADPSQPAGLVVGEVRRGYRWRGEVVRFAEVRAVSRPSSGAAREFEHFSNPVSG